MMCFIMSKLSPEDTRKMKVLMSQMKGFEQTVTEIIYNEKAAKHLRYVSCKDIENS